MITSSQIDDNLISGQWIRFDMKSTAFWLHNEFQIPSHAKIIKSPFSGFKSRDCTSGRAVIICWVLGNELFVLYIWSPKDNWILFTFFYHLLHSKFLPKARDILRPWLIRPSLDTLPPAARILFNSDLSLGLWSFDISWALPAIDTTHLESPALAT